MTSKKTTRRALLSSMLALLLCVSMLVGSTFAWFTDEVTSTGNIIKSGTLDVAMYYGDTAAGATNDASKGTIFNYQYWEPGYTQIKYVKIANEGDLAFKYQLNIIPNVLPAKGDPNLADVIDVYMIPVTEGMEAVTRANYATLGTKAGTLSDLMADADGAAYGIILPAEGSADMKLNDEDKDIAVTGSATYCIVLKMQEEAGNEYQDLSVGEGFKVQLNATQYTYEKDSFGNDYDGEADYDTLPVAKVTKLNMERAKATWGFGGSETINLPLDVAYSFEPTESYEEAQAGKYGKWHADFVVYADQDVAPESMALAGYYVAWCKDYNNDCWVALYGDQTITAGTEVRLVDVMGNGNITVNYEEICNYGNDGIGFRCAAADLTGENEGTTLTVELRLYKTYTEEECLELFGYKSSNVETGEYITVGKYTHTFGENPYTVFTAEDLQKAIDNGETDIALGADITVDTLTVTQKADVNVTIDGNGHTFAGVLTVDGKSATYTTAGLTVKNMVFKADSISADACIQLGDGTNATRYTCNVTVENCTFDVPGAVGVKSYTGGDKNVTITGCTAIANCHSLAQLKGVDGVLVKGCKVYSKNGINFNNSTNVTVDDCVVDTKGYAVRFGESSGGSGAKETYTIKNSTLKSANDEGDATIILRGTADYSTLTIENTTIVGTPDIQNTATDATVIVK